MSYWVESIIEVLEEWELDGLSFLTEGLSHDDISYYLSEYKRDNSALLDGIIKGTALLPASSYDAISSIFQIRSILDEIKQPLHEIVTIETAAHLALRTFQAGIAAGMAIPSRQKENVELDNHRLRDQQEIAGAIAISGLSKNAHDVRYAPLRHFKEKVAGVAKKLWEDGSLLLHHKMAKYLIEEYQDENGKYPFMLLPINDKDGNPLPPDKVVRETLKQLATEMNRRDLVSGQKKHHRG